MLNSFLLVTEKIWFSTGILFNCEAAVCAEDLGLLKDIFPKSSHLNIKKEVHLVFAKWSSTFRRRVYKL